MKKGKHACNESISQLFIIKLCFHDRQQHSGQFGPTVSRSIFWCACILNAAAENKMAFNYLHNCLPAKQWGQEARGSIPRICGHIHSQLINRFGICRHKTMKDSCSRNSRWKRGVSISQSQRAKTALMPLWRGEDCSLSSTFKVKKLCPLRPAEVWPVKWRWSQRSTKRNKESIFVGPVHKNMQICSCTWTFYLQDLSGLDLL